MANSDDRNYGNSTLFREICHFAKWSYYSAIMLAVTFFSTSLDEINDFGIKG